MLSTMQDFPLTITHILRHGRDVYADSTVATFDGQSTAEASFGEVGGRVDRLAAALGRLGVGPEDRVGTFMWNNQRHLEAYFAVSCMGAVLHTLNIRLFPEQLTYVVNHGADKVVVVDDSLVPVLAKVAHELETVTHFVVAGDGDASVLEGVGKAQVVRYEELLAAEEPGYAWPDLDERSAAAMCYTSGTTGNPKGVVYSHRSTFLHSMGITSGASLALNERDKALVIVPMFHANAWGIPYAGWWVGADFVMPQQYVQAEPLSRLIAAERPTVSSGVPTIWNDLLRYGDAHELDLSSLRMITGGGAAVPRALMQAYKERYGVELVQGWGMTETSPVCALAYPPKHAEPGTELDWKVKTGRVLPGVEMRITADDGAVLPRDGEAVGEIEVRGPWITASYYQDPATEKFHDGWLRTGDVGTMDPKGFVQITDRAKDVIKSGGEWISSVELENELVAHPDVVEAAVVGVPDPRFSERPLAAVVLREGAAADPEALRSFLAQRVAKWWLPERWSFIGEVPKTSVGKYDKKVIRSQYADGVLEVVELG